jgi:ATP-dependent RNA helicase MSS116
MSGRGTMSSSNDGPRIIGGSGGGRAGRGRRGERGGAGRGLRGGKGGSSRNHKRSFAPTSSSESYSSPGKRSHHIEVENNGKNDVVISDASPASGFGQQQQKQPPQASLKSSHADTSQEQKLAHMTNQRFADLNLSLPSRRALSEVFQYEYMTSVQAETLPLIFHKDNQDMLAKAKTGTGKTLAFMIPTIEKIIHVSSNSNNNKKKNPNSHTTTATIHCLVISPTRELAQQIAAETSKLLTFHDPKYRKVVICVGGTNKNADLRAFSQSNTPIAVLVANPGRLLDHLQTTTGFAAQISSSLSTLILDECDQLLDMGFRPDIERILSFLKQQTNSSQQLQPLRQTLLFSATIPPSVNEIASLALRPKYHFVDTVGEDAEQTHMHVQQQLMVTTQEELIRSLFAILERETTSTTTCASDNHSSGYKIIVFFTTARLTGYMAELFNSVSGETGYQVLEIVSWQCIVQSSVLYPVMLLGEIFMSFLISNLFIIPLFIPPFV